MFEGLSAGTPIGKIMIGASSIATAFFSPIVPLIVTCFAFTVTDMFYGIKIAYKKKRKIESGKNWSGTLVKILDELTILSLARLLEFSVFGAETEVSVLTGGITVIIALTELWSIIENLNTLNPNGPWKALGKFLKQKGEDYIGTEIDLSDANTKNNNVDSSESQQAV